MFIWNSVSYDVIGQKNCFYLVSDFKFFLSKVIKIIIGKVFSSGNFFTKPCSKEDRIIVNFDIFFLASIFYHMLTFIRYIGKCYFCACQLCSL